MNFFVIIVNALIHLLGLIFKGAVAKFFIFFALFYVVKEFTPYLIELLDFKVIQINSLLGNIDSGVWYFLNLFRFSDGIYIILSAYLTRFIIRRIPIIG